MNEGSYIEYSYTGGMQSFTCVTPGVYKLEVWGAQGGTDSGSTKAAGGYSVGYLKVREGDVIYVCVGNQGGSSVAGTGGGYNGGGNAGSSGTSGAGGGATHMAKITGTLATIGESNKGQVYIVAGGGGGQGGSSVAGLGGGTTGGDAEGKGGTQTAGGSGSNSGSFGQGGSRASGTDGGGGGGGWYGGGAGTGDNRGGGGSGYIGGVPEFTYQGVTYTPSTQQGGNSAAGKAKITLVKLPANGLYLKLNGNWKKVL